MLFKEKIQWREKETKLEIVSRQNREEIVCLKNENEALKNRLHDLKRENVSLSEEKFSLNKSNASLERQLESFANVDYR